MDSQEKRDLEDLITSLENDNRYVTHSFFSLSNQMISGGILLQARKNNVRVMIKPKRQHVRLRKLKQDN